MLVDSHAHLDWDDFKNELEEVILRARSCGVGKIISVGSDLESTRSAIKLARTYKDIYATAGVHPHEANGFDFLNSVEEFQELADSSEVIAIGETGLDYYKGFSSKEAQKKLFLFSIELARKLDKPLIVHSRDAHRECIEILLEHTLQGVIHCFSGTMADIEKYLKMGFYISVGGPITYPNARNLRNMLPEIPLEHLLLETDSPFLPPHGLRGRRNEPANLLKRSLRLPRKMLLGYLVYEIACNRGGRVYRFSSG
jgi:TatD DNase family protein